jgi:hypothetical protein
MAGYKCNKCSKIFKFKSGYDRHINRKVPCKSKKGKNSKPKVVNNNDGISKDRQDAVKAKSDNKKLKRKSKEKPKTDTKVSIKKNNRDATASNMGTFYHRHYTMNIFLDNMNNSNVEYILEEGFEDIDLINFKDKREVYQIKHHMSNKKESLSCNSGLFKVINDEWRPERNNNIDLIKMIIHGEYPDSLKELFVNKKYEHLAKLFLIRKSESMKKKPADPDQQPNEKIKINSEEGKILQYFDSHQEEIKQAIGSIEMYDFFTDSSKYEPFFEKIKLENGPEFRDLISQIKNKIRDTFKDFLINEQSAEYTELKVELVLDKIGNVFMQRMIESKNEKERKIRVDGIINEIKKMESTFKNKDDILKEYLRDYENKILGNLTDSDQQQLAEIHLDSIMTANLNNKDRYELIKHLIGIINNKFLEDNKKKFDLRTKLSRYIDDTYKNIHLSDEEFKDKMHHLNHILNDKNIFHISSICEYLKKLDPSIDCTKKNKISQQKMLELKGVQTNQGSENKKIVDHVKNKDGNKLLVMGKKIKKVKNKKE